jgi:DNA-3-methyladenine glycosylase
LTLCHSIDLINLITNFQKKQKINLTNGPGKLCQALEIDRRLNNCDLCKNELYILDPEKYDFTIESAKRIGIDYAEEAADYPWRFYIKDNIYVSKKPTS